MNGILTKTTGKMYRVLIKNLLLLVLFFLAVTFLAYFAIYLSAPSDSNIAQSSGVISSYFIWLSNLIFNFSLGSTQYGTDVFERLALPLLNTLILTLASLIVGFLISFSLGWIWAKFYKNKLIDFLMRSVRILSSIPLFLAAFLIAYLVKYVAIDLYSESVSIPEIAIYYLTPILTLAFFDGFISEMTDYIKVRIENILNEDFITGLTLRGGDTNRHLLKHIFFDLVSIVSSKLIYLLGGAIVVEIIFGWEGIGLQGFNAVYYRDYSLFMGVFVLIAFLISILNFALETTKAALKRKYRVLAL